jgi:hypothetical protein
VESGDKIMFSLKMPEFLHFMKRNSSTESQSKSRVQFEVGAGATATALWNKIVILGKIFVAKVTSIGQEICLPKKLECVAMNSSNLFSC